MAKPAAGYLRPPISNYVENLQGSRLTAGLVASRKRIWIFWGTAVARRFTVFATFALFLLCFETVRGQEAASTTSATNSDWVLTWHDEFDGPDGSLPDARKWLVQSGGNGWGNNELEYYTSRPQNVRQEDGHLVIEAIAEKFTGPDGIQRDYTSGRLSTKGLFSQKYGRFEARIQNPPGHGIWSAFWMLGDDFSTAGWPACGEIDVMEEFGFSDAKVHGTLHGPGYSSRDSLTSSFRLTTGSFSDSFHIFAVEWGPAFVRFYVDGDLYSSRTPSDLPPGARWVFDHPFFLMMNLAVGGDMPSKPDQSTVFPQRMLVDYVRVYALR